MATADVSFGNVQIMFTEMNEADQNLAVEIAINALRMQDKSDRTIYHKDLAKAIKTELDSQKGGTWNVIVGRSFGSFITHETKTITHFFIGNVGFLMWRHG